MYKVYLPSTGSLPLSASWLPVPLLCITLASSPSRWGAGTSSGAAGASHTYGRPSLALQKHTKSHIDKSAKADLVSYYK